MAGAFSILTNVTSLNAQRQVRQTQDMLARNLARLSSGQRIQNASDDAAGLAISEKLKASIRSLAQGERNALDGVSLIQVADGAMNELGGILIRMRELAMQSSTSTLGDVERGFLHLEFSSLRDELDRIAAVTEFNGQPLLDGSLSASQGGISFQVGIQNTTADRVTVDIAQLDSASIATNFATISVTAVTSARSALTSIDSALDGLAAARANLGAAQNRLMVTIANLGIARENLSAANSRIRDVDVAAETAELTRNNILLQAGVSVLTQANQAPAIALSLIGQ